MAKRINAKPKKKSEWDALRAELNRIYEACAKGKPVRRVRFLAGEK